MIDGGGWAWGTLLVLGAYHGVNPGMGWLFAVALGMQERRGRAVWRTLGPLAVGHGAAIAVAILAALLISSVIPAQPLKLAVGGILLAFGGYRLVRTRHPRFGGMRMTLRDLAVWSFLMASAHGAGLMIVPVFASMREGAEAAAQGARADATLLLLATLAHTAAYLLVTGLLAWLVYERLGVLFLRKAWINLDLIWAVALMVTGATTIVI